MKETRQPKPPVKTGAGARLLTMDTAGATEAIDSQNEAMKRGAKIAEENRTALERFNAEKADLIRLLKVGAINQTTYQRAVAKAAAEYQHAVESIDKPTQAMLTGAKTAKEFATPIETFNAQLLSLKSQLASGAIGVDQFGRAAADAIKELNKDAIKEHGRLAADGAKVTDDFATPQEKYKKRMLELRELADTGAIDIETFGRATREAAGNLSKAMAEANAAGMSTGTVAHDVNSPEAWAAIAQGLAAAKAADAARNLAQREVTAQTSRMASIKSGKLPPGASEATKEAMAAAQRGAAAMRAVENAKQEALAARGHIPRNSLPPSVTQPANQRFTPLQADPLSPPSPKSKDGDQFAVWQRDDVVHVIEYLRAIAVGRPVQIADV